MLSFLPIGCTSEIEVPEIRERPYLDGKVKIVGEAIVGYELTAEVDETTVKIDEISDLSYQWLREEEPIAGAASHTYTLQDSDKDHIVAVRVKRTGYAGSITSALEEKVGENTGLPVLTGEVRIFGEAVVGQTLTADTDGIQVAGGGFFFFEWSRGQDKIEGSNTRTYQIQSGDVGNTFTVEVTHSAYDGRRTSLPTQPVTFPALTGTVGITGEAKVNETLTADTSSLGGSGTISFLWLRDEAAISGATGNTYKVQAVDAGHKITLTVSRAGNAGSVTSLPTATVIAEGEPERPVLTGEARISGDPVAGQTLTAETDGITATESGNFSFQWYRSQNKVEGANGKTYRLQGGDSGHIFVVEVAHSAYDGRCLSSPTEPVTLPALTGTVNITGEAKVNQTLTADTASLGGSGTISYGWLRDEAAISGATGGTYKVQAADVGHKIKVSVSRTDNSGTVTSPPTATVVKDDAEDGSSPAVIRKDLEDLELMQYTAADALIVDATGGQLSYQWFQADSRTGAGKPIAGKTNAAYVPSSDVLGTSYFYVEITNVDYWPEGLGPTTIKSRVAEVRIIENTGGSGIGSPETSPDAVVARLESYLSKADFESLFPLRIGSPGWRQYMQDNYGHAAFPNWQSYEDYYSYDNLKEAIRELAAWGYVLETRNLPGGLTNYNSRGYIVNKASGRTYPVFEEDGFNAEWNQSKPVIKTVVDYGSFINSVIDNDNRRELAGLLANMAHETGAGWEGAPGGEERWGFFFNEEVSVVTGGGYTDSYTSHESVEYPPVPGQSYHGRGGIQLSWNYNYGPFSILAFGDKNVLLQDPGRVAREGKLGWMSGIWFWMTPQLPKASSHDVMQSTWKPEGIFQSGAAKGVTWGFGATINIINGGFEAGGRQKQRRINHYRDLTGKTGANISGEKLDTVGMSPWT